MGVHREFILESTGQVEVLAGPTGRRRWPDEVKGRIVAETLIPGVTVKEVARRHGLTANHLSSWRTLARQGLLCLPDHAEAEFATVAVAPPVAGSGPTDRNEADHIDLIGGGIVLRLGAWTPAARVAELVSALRGVL